MAGKHIYAEKTKRIENSDEHTGHFVIDETSFLDNALRVAVEKFKENAVFFRGEGERGAMGKVVAEGLAKEFERQALQVSEFIEILDRSHGLALLHVEPEETPDQEPDEDASGPRI